MKSASRIQLLIETYSDKAKKEKHIFQPGTQAGVAAIVNVTVLLRKTHIRNCFINDNMKKDRNTNEYKNLTHSIINLEATGFM